MSGAWPRAMAENGAPVAGSIIGRVSPLAAGSQRLAMKCAAGVRTRWAGESGAFM